VLQANRAIPIVFTQTPDPVGAGFVESLARPGGNVTSFTVYEYGIGAKWLELLKEIAPHVTRAAVVRDAAIASGIGQWGAIQTAAPSFGVELRPVDVRDTSEIERAIAAFARSPNGGLIVAGSTLAIVHRDLIVTLAARHKLPAVYSGRFFVRSGGLISYGPVSRAASPRSRLRRSHLEGREASRSTRAGADQVRVGDKPQDREGARPGNPTVIARPRRRSHRMKPKQPPGPPTTLGNMRALGVKRLVQLRSDGVVVVPRRPRA
jgi:hypothetical protein